MVLAPLLTLLPGRAEAWCQSCTVSNTPSTCAQPCFCPTDSDPEARYIEWVMRRIDYSLEMDGSRDLTRPEVEAVFARSFAKWTGLTCSEPLDFDVQLSSVDSTTDVPDFEDSVNSLGFVDDWTTRGHSPGAFALTTTWFRRSTGEIIDADMELNQQNWTFAICEETGCEETGTMPEVDLENTVTHELGHFFGLAHTESERNATMWACAEPGETLKRDLAPDDIEGMCEIYREGIDEGCGCVAAGSGTTRRGLLAGLFTLAAVARRARRRRRPR